MAGLIKVLEVKKQLKGLISDDKLKRFSHKMMDKDKDLVTSAEIQEHLNIPCTIEEGGILVTKGWAPKRKPTRPESTSKRSKTEHRHPPPTPPPPRPPPPPATTSRRVSSLSSSSSGSDIADEEERPSAGINTTETMSNLFEDIDRTVRSCGSLFKPPTDEENLPRSFKTEFKQLIKKGQTLQQTFVEVAEKSVKDMSRTSQNVENLNASILKVTAALDGFQPKVAAVATARKCDS